MCGITRTDPNKNSRNRNSLVKSSAYSGAVKLYENHHRQWYVGQKNLGMPPQLGIIIDGMSANCLTPMD